MKVSIFNLLVFVLLMFGWVQSTLAAPIQGGPTSGQFPVECAPNHDKRYDREKILEAFADILFEAVPTEARSVGRNIVLDQHPVGFSVWDLSDLSNRDSKSSGRCLEFIEGHVYHFTDENLPFSYSHVAILERGKLKIFRSLNCPEGKSDREFLLNYISSNVKDARKRMKLISRVRNYRRFQQIPNIDVRTSVCKEPETILANPDPRYKRFDVYSDMARILLTFAPASYAASVGLPVIRDIEGKGANPNARAINFFVFDLTEPSNKQTTSNERVDFIEGHVYHFAFLDEPYSYSHIGILEDGKLKVFSGINCPNIGARLKDVLNYLDTKLENGPAKNELIKRVKAYRKYGEYLPSDGSNMIRCSETLKIRTNFD